MKKVKFSLPMAAFVLGIGLAAVTSLSSFTKVSNKSGSVTYRYYNKSGNLNDETPSNFIYRDGLTDDCITSSKECTAEWTTTNAPLANQSPADAGSPMYAGNTTSGTYNGH